MPSLTNRPLIVCQSSSDVIHPSIPLDQFARYPLGSGGGVGLGGGGGVACTGVTPFPGCVLPEPVDVVLLVVLQLLTPLQLPVLPLPTPLLLPLSLTSPTPHPAITIPLNRVIISIIQNREC